MKHHNITLCATLLLSLSLTTVNAQEATTASGGDASGSGGSVAYSVGQIVYSTYTSTNGSVAQGVQQPYEISVVTSIAGATGINLDLKAYPNPTSDYLTLRISNFNNENLSYQITDINGKLVEVKKIEGDETSIAMNHLVSATYFLQVKQNNKEVKTFIIIKN